VPTTDGEEPVAQVADGLASCRRRPWADGRPRARAGSASDIGGRPPVGLVHEVADHGEVVEARSMPAVGEQRPQHQLVVQLAGEAAELRPCE
jgi:hypothetical protein